MVCPDALVVLVGVSAMAVSVVGTEPDTRDSDEAAVEQFRSRWYEAFRPTSRYFSLPLMDLMS